MILTFVAFDLGYLSRFIWLRWGWFTVVPSFGFFVVENLVFMSDGITLVLLLILHRQSFIKSNSSIPLSSQE